MINREDMLELTRRMTASRNCFDRVAGVYVDDTGEIDGTFNIHFGKLSNKEKNRNLQIAKIIPFSKTNEQLKEYVFRDEIKGKDSFYQLLNAMQQCGLKNDALLDIFYEQMADGYPVDQEFCVFIFHGIYDVPIKAKDKENLRESEEVYDFILCTVSEMREEYEPKDPVFGFLYPAFEDRSMNRDKIYIFHQNPEKIEEGLLHKILK